MKSVEHDTPQISPVTSGRGWSYVDGYLVNEYLGRVGHTPSWVVEVEGSDFVWFPKRGVWGRIRALFAKPRIIQRNRRRLAYVWPLVWPPPDDEGKAKMRSEALAAAKQCGGPVSKGCGVCHRVWESGPTPLDGRMRHLCPDCAESIEQIRNEIPPSALSTWMWCGVAGFGGLLLQLLFHYSWGWTAVPLALVAGWLMGTANGPNFERHPILSPLCTVVLVLILQAAGWTFVIGSDLQLSQGNPLGALFVWTLVALPPTVVLGWIVGSLGVFMALMEQRLHRP